MSQGGVVVAGQNNAVSMGVVDEVPTMGLRVARLNFCGLGDLAKEFVFTPALFPDVVNLGVLKVFPLSLTRRVIHQRTKTDQRVVNKWRE